MESGIVLVSYALPDYAALHPGYNYFAPNLIRNSAQTSSRPRMLHFQRVSPVGASLQQHHFHRATILGIADVRVPVLRYLAGNRFV